MDSIVNSLICDKNTLMGEFYLPNTNSLYCEIEFLKIKILKITVISLCRTRSSQHSQSGTADWQLSGWFNLTFKTCWVVQWGMVACLVMAVHWCGSAWRHGPATYNFLFPLCNSVRPMGNSEGPSCKPVLWWIWKIREKTYMYLRLETITILSNTYRSKDLPSFMIHTMTPVICPYQLNTFTLTRQVLKACWGDLWVCISWKYSVKSEW